LNKSLLLVAALPMLLMACDQSADQQLEGFSLEITADDPEAGEFWYETSVEGTATVTGADRDHTVTVEGADSTVELVVHSPAVTDLTVFDGRDVTVDVSGRNMAVRDDDGIAYAADAGGYRWQLEQEFGEGFADWGSVVRTEMDGTELYKYRTAVFAGDDGPVEIHPGDSDSVTIDGIDYDVTVIASYTIEETMPFAAIAACGGPSDLLSYEMERVEQPREPRTVARPEGLEMARGMGCGGW